MSVDIKSLFIYPIYITFDILQTTGLAGLAVAAHPHHTLGVLYGKILRCLQKMPPDASYRKYTEQIITEKYNFVKICLVLAETITSGGESQPLANIRYPFTAGWTGAQVLMRPPIFLHSARGSNP
ncbi:NADH dehydrogenase [ubiquinone] 1 alpha subcomplex subunit 5 [Chionoecetes opilio]|uniref:NADH dehydrogenase [ubiquinone] 1 alpha subcomplex subunit 5 n=1 Tax=Chionoecetes opilio TaxID=41210 RepID=A0A8J5CTD7_CHIOP|nr:NADH dehydrogenase [ubiquinone] 1 alpha subcomplex subunit 5 [Chionoecetes opilio]